MEEVVTASVIDSVEGLKIFREEWHEAFVRVRCRNPFLSPEWMIPWWYHWGGNGQILLVVVRDGNGRVLAVAPFFIRTSCLGKLGARALCLIGTHKYVGSYHLDIIQDPQYASSSIEAIANLIGQYSEKWDYIELSNCHEASSALAELRGRLKLKGMTEKVVASEARLCPYTELGPTFEGYLKLVSSNQRYNFRRRRRALERQGVEFVVVKGRVEVHEMFQELLRLHRMRFEDMEKHSAFLQPSVMAFHQDVVKQLENAGMLSIFTLRRQGETIAALYGFSSGRRFTFYQSGMDPLWSQLSIGLVMIGCSIEEAIRSGHDEFDFLAGPQLYKMQWCGKVRRNVTVCLFKDGLWSLQARAQIEMVDRMKQLKRAYWE